MSDLVERYGPWAVVTGAAVGFGSAYARFLADAGLSVVVVDLDADGADAEAARLRERGVETRSIGVDLGDPVQVEAVVDHTADLDVGLVVANAAVSVIGPFADRTIESLRTEVAVNVSGTLGLVHGFLPRLRSRERAGLVLMSSQSSRRGSPMVANYAGTKAYLAILAESLWDELADEGVDVLGVLPGTTRTPGFESSGARPGLGTANVMEPAEVVPEVFDVLGSQPSLIPGEANRENEALMASFDRADAVRMVGQVMREMYPPEG